MATFREILGFPLFATDGHLGANKPRNNIKNVYIVPQDNALPTKQGPDLLAGRPPITGILRRRV